MFQFDYWKLLAGLGIFLFGMGLLENAIKDISGRAFRRIIRDFTNTRIKAILNGTAVTAILQSSSAVSLMVLAFVGAGIMNMETAIGVILGSNVGTTLTAWIVATLGFKVKIETFALPFIGIAAIGLILFKPGSRPYHFTRLLIGFGFLFLGLDYMKTSVESFSNHIDPAQLENLNLFMYLLIGAGITALMQASAATIAITLTALNSQLMTFEMAAAMVIGANIGTTFTILIGAVGGTPPKKRVAASHLIFNLVTGLTAFLCLPLMIVIVTSVIDIKTNSPIGLALFHTLFNITGVLLFAPFVTTLTRILTKIVPEQEMVLSVHIAFTPIEEIESAVVALRNEIVHLLQECQLYTLRLLQIDDRLVFEEVLPFERGKRKKLSNEDLYNYIKRLHSAIIAYYSDLQSQKLDDPTAKILSKKILATRNIMNAAKNFKGILGNLEEFEASDSHYVTREYERFRKKLINLYHDLNSLNAMMDSGQQRDALIQIFSKVEQADDQFIKGALDNSRSKVLQQIDLSTLFLVNRLFTQSCRMIIFSVKDLILTPEDAAAFDRAMEF